jgi:hypothetical protein
MIARVGSGWQTVLADLSLILFMVTAAAVSEAGPAGQTRTSGLAISEPVAVWREVAGGPALGDWLAAQPADPRQRLTLVFHGAPAEAPAALTPLLETLSGSPRLVRLVIEPGTAGPLEAQIAYDIPQSSEGPAPR